MGDSAQKIRFCIRSSISGGAKRETKAGNGSCIPKTASLEQLTDLLREIQQQDVCDMEVDLAEVMWQESDAIVWNTLSHKLETVVECLPAEEDDVEDRYARW